MLPVQATKVDTILNAKLSRTKKELSSLLFYRVISVRIFSIPSILRRARMRSQHSNSPEQYLRPLRYLRCQSKVLSMSWIDTAKVSYLLASNNEMSTVYYIPLAISRDNFHLRDVVTIN
jgi:hypothetical protein